MDEVARVCNGGGRQFGEGQSDPLVQQDPGNHHTDTSEPWGKTVLAREQREPREQDLVVEEGTGEPVITTL